MPVGLVGMVLRGGAALAAMLGGAALFSAPASAQSIFPCGGGPNEQQIGMDTNGPVTVPLCVARPTAPAAGPGDEASAYRWMPPPLPKPPRGWRPVFGAWKSFESERIPGTDRFTFDFVISLGHATPEAALAEVEAQCLRKPRVYADQESTCRGFVIKEPYVTVVQYPYEPPLGSQQGTILVYDTRVPRIDGATTLDNGEVVICSMPTTPRKECTRVLATMINGVIPGKDGGSEQARIGGTRLADGKRADGDAARHLDDRQKRILPRQRG